MARLRGGQDEAKQCAHKYHDVFKSFEAESVLYHIDIAGKLPSRDHGAFESPSKEQTTPVRCTLTGCKELDQAQELRRASHSCRCGYCEILASVAQWVLLARSK